MILLCGAMCVLSAQVPRIGLVETYGFEKLSPEKIARVAGLEVGQPVPASKVEVQQSLERDDDIIESHVEGYCCWNGNAVLYVGVLERGVTPFSLHSPPAEDLALPLKLDLVYQRLLRALEAAHERGATGESYSRGYPLSEDDEARRAQETLALLVDEHLSQLGDVLRRSADSEVRRAAAYILAYASDKQAAEAQLQYALRDFEPEVRMVALRSLDLVRRSLPAPDAGGTVISPTWLVEMLNSVSFADRVESARLLAELTSARPERAMVLLEERALPSLAQMARWKVPEHARAPYLLLGRILGLPEAEVVASFAKGQRDVVFEPLRKRAAEKKRFLIF